jgi:hypothetical protein
LRGEGGEGRERKGGGDGGDFVDVDKSRWGKGRAGAERGHEDEGRVVGAATQAGVSTECEEVDETGGGGTGVVAGDGPSAGGDVAISAGVSGYAGVCGVEQRGGRGAVAGGACGIKVDVRAGDALLASVNCALKGGAV